MASPEPHPGLVIGYAYLWRRESLAGEVEGRKDRPCAIVAAVDDREGGDKIVTVLPITHTPPVFPEQAVEIPQATKQRLGLDSERSWIICAEANQFVWPGFDLRPVSRRDKNQFAYGVLPPKLFKQIRNKLLYLAQGRRFGVIGRNES